MRAAVLFLSAVAVAASSSPACLSSFDASVDYFPEKPLALNAQFFTITYHKYYKVLSVRASLTDAWTRYALVQCGAPAPANASSYAATFTVPVARGVGVSSTTMLPLFELLGRLDALAVFGSDPEYVSSMCVKAKLAAKETVAAYTGSWPATDNATLAAKDVSVYFSEIGSPAYYHMAAWPEALERSSLASLDYVFFLAAFLNEEARANAVVSAARARYTCTIEEVKSALAPDSYSLRMNILWAYWVGEYGTDVWWVGSCPNYYCELASAVGGQILTPGSFGMKPSPLTPYETYSDTEFMKMAARADLFIYVGTNFSVVQAAKAKMLAAIPAYIAGRVYDTAGRGSSDWFEWRYAEPDLLLQEIFAAAVPRASNHERVFLRRAMTTPEYSEEPIKVQPPCRSTTVPAATLASSCPGIAKTGVVVASDNAPDLVAKKVAIAVPVAVGGALLLAVAVLLGVVLQQRHALQGYRRTDANGDLSVVKVAPA